MKTLLITLITFSTFAAFGQFGPDTTATGPSPTTEAEYNYLTKGYKVQIESGLDMKKGYTIVDASVVRRSSYTFDIKFLMREKNNEMAGILIITKSETWGNTYYICLPINNPDLINKYYASIAAWDKSLLLEYTLVTSSMFASMSSAVNEAEKK